jgi:hypothetical protein
MLTTAQRILSNAAFMETYISLGMRYRRDVPVCWLHTYTCMPADMRVITAPSNKLYCSTVRESSLSSTFKRLEKKGIEE